MSITSRVTPSSLGQEPHNHPLSIRDILRNAANQVGVNSKLLKAICYVESKHKPNVINKNDGDSPSYGLCQVKLATAQFMGFSGKESELIQPEINALYAAKYLKYQLKRYSNSELKAIRAYNKGHFDGELNSMYHQKVLTALNGFNQ